MNTMEDGIHTYEFDYAGNSYFQGRDGLVTRDDGKSIRINMRDRCMAVNVKDHKGSFHMSMDDLPEDAQRKANELRRHGGPEDEFGRDFVDRLYEQAQESWWHDAEHMAQEADFRGVHSDGRSGGWCVIEGTEWLSDNFPTTDPPDADDISVEAEDRREAFADRDRFLQLAFDLVDNIQGVRTGWFVELIEDEHDQLEARREACIIRGTD